MKIEYTYEVVVTVDEKEGAQVEKALRVAARVFDTKASVDETDAVEQDEDEDKDA